MRKIRFLWKPSLSLSTLLVLSCSLNAEPFQRTPKVYATNFSSKNTVRDQSRNYKSLSAVLDEVHLVHKVDILYETKTLPNEKVVFDIYKYNNVELLLNQLLNPFGLKPQKVTTRTYAVVTLEGEKTAASNEVSLTEAPLTSGTSLSSSFSNYVNGKLQDVRITGKVEDAQGPLAGVSVKVRGSTTGTQTDGDGNYSINVENPNTALVFSYLGYVTQEVVPGNRTVLNITMVASNQALQEVVVVGYGQQKKSLVTGAISSVKAEELKTVSSSRIDQALQGRTAGVNVMPSSGAPGAMLSVRVRGSGSNRSAEPLYIVDGVRAGGIEYLDPSEIGSIEILKDAASAAIYGAEGANGVVIISTKTGKVNSPIVNYTFQLGKQSPRELTPMMNAPQYQQYMSEAKLAGPTAAEAAAVGTGTNWADVLLEDAPQQHHAVNFSGGSNQSSYLVGATYFSQNGIIGGDKSQFERFTVRINTDHKIKPWLNVGEKLSYSNFTSRGIAENNEFGSVVGSMMALDPITPAIYTGALPAHVQTAINQGRPLVRDGNGNYYGISKFIQGEYGNPLAQVLTTQGRTNQNKIVGNVYGDVDILSGLKFTTRFGIDAAFVRNHTWSPTFWYSSESLNTTPKGSDYQRNYFNWQFENYATYTKSLGNHNFNVLAGTSSIKRLYNNLEGSYSGLFKEEEKWSYPDFVSDTPDKLAKITGQYRTETLLSYYGRLNYEYKDKYLFAATLRYDGSSLFAEENRWGTFPSLSAGWILSNEDFYSANLAKTINYLKVRASWGQNGSLSNVGVGSWQASIGQNQQYADANGNFVLGAAPTNLQYRQLTWETSEQLNIGTDINFFDSKLIFTVDWFKKTTKDLITNGAAPFFAGNVLNNINSGNVENKGWEFELSYRNATSGGLKYELSGNISPIKNKVTKTNPLYPIIRGAGVGTGWNATRFEEGYPIWYFYGYKTAGIFQNQAQINSYLADNGITGYSPKPGDPILVDVNKDKSISDLDQTYIGDPVPDFTYGARINLSYKGFDFMTFLQGSQGNEVLMGFVRNDRRLANKPSFFFTDRWTGDGSTNSWFSPEVDAKAYNSDFMVFDGSFARIRQLQLGYTLSNSVVNKLRIKNARVYVSLDDFFTFTDYPGLDPEGGNNGGNSAGIDRGTYPTPRKVMAGLSFSF